MNRTLDHPTPCAPPQASGWRDPEIVVEPVGQIGVGAERVTLAPAPVERAHEILREPFPKWMFLDRRGERIDDEGMVTQGEPDVGQLLDCHYAQVVEPRDLG